MKKNFMAIASLLIAAMLLVVSCAPEANVEGKVEDGLVEAVIGLGRSANDIDFTSGNKNAQINKKKTKTPAWNSSDTGAPIYGKVENETPIEGTFTILQSVDEVKLGRVTPGLWNIHVIGYYNEKKVLEGKTSYYFNGSGTKATVFVAPVSSTDDVSVKIELKMQDLGSDNYNKIDYSFKNFNGTTVSSDTPMKPSTDPTVTHPAGVKVYKATVNVKSGYNTVTFSLPGYNEGKGGITKTFLAIPGVEVTITGSVTPAEFVEGNAKIEVLSIDGGEVKVTDASGSTPEYEEAIIKPADDTTNSSAVTVKVMKLANNVTYKFEYDGSDADDIINTTVGLKTDDITRKYQWYVAGKEIRGATGSSYDFKETAAGLYNVTCVATVTFTKDGQTYNLQTSATKAYVRVLEATTENQ